MVDLSAHVELDCDPKELGVTELVYYPVLEKYWKKMTVLRISRMRSAEISMI